MTLAEELKIIKDGTAEIIPEEELAERLKLARKEKKPLRVKLGIDASGPDIHLGFSVVLRKLRQFQDLGHKAVLIVGDFTGRIGDPSGVNKTRPQLTLKEIKKNMKRYENQVFRILRKDRSEIRYNSEWSDPLKAADIVRLASKSTVARMIERDDFTKRLNDGSPIALHEFLYPLFQAYDSVAVEADIEMGGTDQKWNLLVGRDFQREFGQSPQIVLTMPLLEGLDGVRKMSKSYDNYIAIEDSPKEMFGKVMSIPDTLILRYFQLAAFVPSNEIIEMKEAIERPKSNPRDLKADLGKRIVALYYSEKEAVKAEEEFDRIFKEKGLPDHVEEFSLEWKEKKIWIVSLLTESGCVSSGGEARRLIQQGGVSIDGERVREVDFEVSLKSDFLLKVGKRKFLKILPQKKLPKSVKKS
jgi:tyrosyl-tRNA synthetase